MVRPCRGPKHRGSRSADRPRPEIPDGIPRIIVPDRTRPDRPRRASRGTGPSLPLATGEWEGILKSDVDDDPKPPLSPPLARGGRSNGTTGRLPEAEGAGIRTCNRRGSVARGRGRATPPGSATTEWAGGSRAAVPGSLRKPGTAAGMWPRCSHRGRTRCRGRVNPRCGGDDREPDHRGRGGAAESDTRRPRPATRHPDRSAWLLIHHRLRIGVGVGVGDSDSGCPPSRNSGPPPPRPPFSPAGSARAADGAEASPSPPCRRGDSWPPSCATGRSCARPGRRAAPSPRSRRRA